MSKVHDLVTSTEKPISSTRKSGRYSFAGFRRADEEEKRLVREEKHRLELEAIAKNAATLRAIEDEEKRIVEEQNRIIRNDYVTGKIANAFGTKTKIDTTPIRKEAIDNILPKTLVPEQTSYPEPFVEEPALNQELAEFKKKINEHLHKMGFAGTGGGGAGIVGDLDDVDISNRGHKTILMYNDVTKKYEFTDPDMDAGISNEDDSGDEIILNATTSSGADEGGSIQQENSTRMSAGASSDTTVSSLSISTPTLTLTDSEDDTVTVDLSSLVVDVATEATNITASANNSTNETVYPVFVDGATGTQGLETDTGLTYNPSTGLITTAAITTTGDATLGDDLILDSDAAVIQFGDDQEIKLTHNHNQGLEITSTHDAPLTRRGEDVFIVLDQTAAGGTDAGDNIILDASAAGTDVGDDIIGEDEVFLHTGMQRDVINIVGSDGKIKKSIAGFSAGSI